MRRRLIFHLIGFAGLVIAVGAIVFKFALHDTPAQAVRNATEAAKSGRTVSSSVRAKHKFPTEVVNRFVRGCAIRNAPLASCRCLVTAREATMSLDEFNEADRLIRAKRPLSPELNGKLNAALSRCR